MLYTSPWSRFKLPATLHKLKKKNIEKNETTLFLSDTDYTKYNFNFLTSKLHSETCQKQTLNKLESCINWTLDKVLI
jgi:hypothetical protein